MYWLVNLMILYMTPLLASTTLIYYLPLPTKAPLHFFSESIDGDMRKCPQSKTQNNDFILI